MATQPDALWAELNALVPQGPSPRAAALLWQLRERAEQMQRAGDPDAADQMAAVLFAEGVVTGQGVRATAAFTAAIPHATLALEARPDASRRDRLASLHYNLGNIHSSAERHADAEIAYRAALPLQEANVAERPEEAYLRNHLAQTRFNLGNTCLSLQRLDEAADWFRSAGELWTRLVAEEPQTVGHAHNLARSCFNLAYVTAGQGATAEATGAYRRAQQTWERLLSQFGEHTEQRFDLSRCYHNHSLLLSQTGRYEEALTAIERAVANFDILVRNNPRNGTFATLRQQAHQQRDDLRANSPVSVADRALAQTEHLAAQARSAKDWQRLRQLGTSLLNLAADFRQANRPVEMERIYRAIAGLLAETAASDPTPETAHLEAAVWFDLNIDLRAMGLYDGAEEAVRGALRRWLRLRTRYPQDGRWVTWLAGAHNNLGINSADTGRLAPAEAAYLAALAMRQEAARAAPDDAQNQLFLGGTLCNIGNILLDRGRIDDAREFYHRAIRTIEAVQDRLPGNELVGQYLRNCRGGLAGCDSHLPTDAGQFSEATLGWPQAGPPAMTFSADDELAPALRRADALRLDGSATAEQATAELVALAPDRAEAWLLRGLVLAGFRGTQLGDRPVPWLEEPHEQAMEAFYEALVCRPDCYEARMYKGLTLRQAAHAAQAGLGAMHTATESMPEAQREALLAPRRRRFQWDVARSRESLEGAARLRPNDGWAWYELAELYRGLGYPDEAAPYLERLREVDEAWWRRVAGPDAGQ